jgi:hypothetical protein
MVGPSRSVLIPARPGSLRGTGRAGAALEPFLVLAMLRVAVTMNGEAT